MMALRNSVLGTTLLFEISYSNFYQNFSDVFWYIFLKDKTKMCPCIVIVHSGQYFVTYSTDYICQSAAGSCG